MITKKLRKALGTVALLTIIVGLSSCGNNQETIPITTNSDKARDYYVKARVFQENLRTQQAIEYYRLALEEDANFALAHLGLGFSLFNTNITEGFESLNRAVALAGNVSEGEKLWIEASEAGLNNDTKSSKELLEKLVILHHGDVRAHNLLGNFYYGQQEYDRAVTELRKANEIDPDYPPPYNMMGYAYRFLGKYKNAEKAFKTYIKLIPDNPNPYDSYAELLMKIGEYDESIEMYQKALSVDPSFFPSRQGIATNYNFLGKHGKARQVLREWFETTEEDSEKRVSHFGMAVSYADEGNLVAALDAVMKMFEVSEESEDFVAMINDLTLAGIVALEMSNPSEATSYYDRAAEIMESSDRLTESIKDQTRAGLHFQLSRIASATGDFEEAYDRAEQYREATVNLNNPGQTRNYHELLGTIALAEGDFKEAIEELKQANQENTYNLYRMMLAYDGLGDEHEARKMCETIANFNQLANLNYSFVRQKARRRLATI